MKVKEPLVGGIAVSTQGRDAGKMYVIVDVDALRGRVYLADGKSKTALGPKKKNVKHLRLLPVRSALAERLNDRACGNVYNYEIATELRRIAASTENAAERRCADQNKAED